MSKFARVAGLVGVVLVASASSAPAANPKEIDAAIQKGTAALKARYNRAGAAPSAADHGIGGTCLAGLALLEAGTPPDDPAVKNITALVRNAAFTQTSTYPVALCLLYLDRLGDPADVPIIQMLAVRLVVGQTNMGGWGYQCIAVVSPEDERRLRAMKPNQQAGKLHPDVAEYATALARAVGATPPGTGDDNSNTQFAVLAVWAARKHGVPVDGTLDAVLKRFMLSQDARTGNWPYSGPLAGGGGGMPGGSPSMYCAGLLGMATGVARREERRPQNPPPGAQPGDMNPAPATPSDPFAGGDPKPAPKQPQPRPADAIDKVVQVAFAGLTLTTADQIANKGLLQANGSHGTGDLYFLWSLERVCVVYGIEKLTANWNGRPVIIDWYDLGSTVIVRSQSPDGTWGVGGYGAEVNTAFAVLFLCRSNLARDLSSKVQKDPTNTELRAGRGPAATDLLPDRPTAATPSGPAPVVSLPNPTGSKPVALATDLLKAANDSEWVKQLVSLRDGKGSDYTQALTIAAAHTEGERKKVVREVLAERLCRMTPATLRTMLKAEQPELRRAAALACAMKDDPGHIPDLIDALLDDNDAVVRAAKAGLKALTGKDFGPPPNATAVQKATAATEWRKWYAEQKK